MLLPTPTQGSHRLITAVFGTSILTTSFWKSILYDMGMLQTDGGGAPLFCKVSPVFF
jgi:hypothetical protein